ncbi:hypothetical protein KUTeg_013436 [Tegillarca granosa]|uniref:Coiled-coil domain-containing protein 85C n=1 Tax=Tegillarca granosa TaxID=220873 RepID=A0ABQ9EY67_TEGGR|nr:hypothetical protein KUTeg_013436 [Tegillarca granosa]
MSGPPTPSSLGGSSARSTPVPGNTSSSGSFVPYKTITPSPSITALSKLNDDQLHHKDSGELIRIIRRVESENRSLLAEHSSIIKDVNRRIQIHLLEIRGLKDINQKLQDDNQELRDLCCFLDDDRQRGRKLAREWQRFGRYTASVMRSEVSAYQEKLKDLEDKQLELISDNTELKELCLYLDQERIRYSTSMRDEGDGSSNSTVAGNEEPHPLPIGMNIGNGQDSSNQDAELAGNQNYIHRLENQIRQLEEEKKQLAQRNGGDGYRSTDHRQSTEKLDTGQRNMQQRTAPVGNPSEDISQQSRTPTPGASGDSPNKPEAVVHAMKVLEVHEQLERPKTDVGGENLDDKEKAIVREMCNVVWRKLGDVGSERSTPHPVYENIPARQNSSAPPIPPPNRQPPPPPTSQYKHQSHLQTLPNRSSHHSTPGQSPPKSAQTSTTSPAGYNSNTVTAPQSSYNSHTVAAPQSSYNSHTVTAPQTNYNSHTVTASQSSYSSHSDKPPIAPGTMQTVHSQSIPSHHQYRSPPPPSPLVHHRPPPPPPSHQHYQDRPPPLPPTHQSYDRNPPPPVPPHRSYQTSQHNQSNTRGSRPSSYHEGSEAQDGGRESSGHRDRRGQYESRSRRKSHDELATLDEIRDRQKVYYSRESSASRNSNPDSRNSREIYKRL